MVRDMTFLFSTTDQAELDRLRLEGAKSRELGHRLDAWAFEQCAQDILDRYAGIRKCPTCGRRRHKP